MVRAYIVDDESLAIDRMKRLLEKSGRVEVIGSTTQPRAAVHFLEKNATDVLFLDVCMPELTGFELLSEIASPPIVVLTTAHEQFALQAFEVDSIDYLLKPVQPQALDRALNKVEALLGKSRDVVDFRKLFEEVTAALKETSKGYPDRIPSRLGDRVCFIELARVTHFYADDKLTYAVADGKSYCIDHSITELEKRLNPKHFIRIHRSTLLNAAWVKEIAPSFSGSLIVRLRDSKTTELVVARGRSHELKTRLGV